LRFRTKDELDWRPIKNIAKVFRRGDVVRAKVLSMDDEKKEMVLSIRLATPIHGNSLPRSIMWET